MAGPRLDPRSFLPEPDKRAPARQRAVGPVVATIPATAGWCRAHARMPLASAGPRPDWLPWFGDKVELEPVAMDRTRIRWSATMDVGHSALERLRVRLAARWLRAEAGRRLRELQAVAAAAATPPAAIAPERVRVGA